MNSETMMALPPSTTPLFALAVLHHTPLPRVSSPYAYITHTHSLTEPNKLTHNHPTKRSPLLFLPPSLPPPLQLHSSSTPAPLQLHSSSTPGAGAGAGAGGPPGGQRQTLRRRDRTSLLLPFPPLLSSVCVCASRSLARSVALSLSLPRSLLRQRVRMRS